MIRDIAFIPPLYNYQHNANHLKFVPTLHKKLKPLFVQSDVLITVVDPLCGTPTVNANDSEVAEMG
jgi:hypothetical protein